MDVDSLESALNSAKDTSQVLGGHDSGEPESGVRNQESDKVQMSRDEEIGFHKGAVNTLMAERAELLKMVQNVEGIASMHAKRLKELGVDLK